MMKGGSNPGFLIFRSLVLLQFVPLSWACIYLLNGWMPMSVYKRTGLADIVISARVIRAFKARADRTEADTYSAQVRILEVFKGIKLLREIPVTENEPMIYNISNFGDKKMCYADVLDGDSYILFLTPYKQRLSAKYDDIFGAAADYTKHNVKQILEQLGTNLDPWTVWSPCSSSCNGGHQTRQRMCKKKATSCDGESFDRRQCNNFQCNEMYNMFSYLGIQKLPLGVKEAQGRSGAYNITQQAKLFSPLAPIFREGFPRDFSLIMSILFPQNFTGYFFTLSDLMGRQRFALQYTSTDSLVLRYSNGYDSSNERHPKFSVNFRDEGWHQLAFSIRDNSVVLYSDCDVVLSKELIRSKEDSLGNNLMLALGPYFARYGVPFHGLIEQLVITTDPESAAQQCHTQTSQTDQAIKDDGEVDNNGSIQTTERVTSKKTPETTTSETVSQVTAVTLEPSTLPSDAAEWSSWSACSRTCGRGRQTRVLYCGNNVLESCTENETEREQTRKCYNGQCDDADSCATPCQNGGQCLSQGLCACPVGFTGSLCETAMCNPRCRHGGQCTSPGVCTCPQGYSPPDCKPTCRYRCHNGGKCIRKNKCKCPGGYKGPDCSTPVCRRGCYNGGRCVAPKRCSCPRGYSGSRCEKADCTPPCQNGGNCIYPGICMCKTGYDGALCERMKCRKTCKHGGVCSRPNRCSCPRGFTGRWCHRKQCRISCYNGGKCRGRRCRCRSGYHGTRCEKRDCKYETYLMPYTRAYRKLQREEYTTTCGPWRWKTCVKTRVKYVTISHTMYRTAYRCA